MQQINTSQTSRSMANGWRIYGMSVARDTTPTGANPGATGWSALATDVKDLGFDTLLVPQEVFLDPPSQRPCVVACAQAGLRLVLDVVLSPQAPQDDLENLRETLAHAQESGVEIAVMLRGLGGGMAAHSVSEIISRLQAEGDHLGILVWTPGMRPKQVAALEGLPIAGVTSSLPWWNFRDSWLVEEYERLSAVGPIIAPIADPRDSGSTSANLDDIARRLAVASLAGHGLLVPEHHARVLGHDRLMSCLTQGSQMNPDGRGLRRLTGPMSAVTALFRSDEGGRLLLLNPDAHRHASVNRSLIERRLPDGFVLERESEGESQRFDLGPAGWSSPPLIYADWIAKYGTTSRQQRSSLTAAMRSPRIAIESVRPAVDGGRFAVKRTLGETVVISANIFMDGHEELAAEVLWRPVNETEWHRTPMRAVGNDAWEAHIFPRKLGRYVFTVRAWWDVWQSFRVQLQKKYAASVDVSLEVEEARRILQGLLKRARLRDEESAETIENILATVGKPMDDAPARKLRPRPGGPRALPPETHADVVVPAASTEQVEALLDEGLARAIAHVADPDFEVHAEQEYSLCMERNEAMFSSWYELFPRSQGPSAETHGTLRDVIERLPEIRRMGFDVLYFPPIHPIGQKNRKGRNNSLQAGPGDPGSPYAIGSEDGGHDALHPELGTLEDFQDLIAAAHRNGLEIALDFAIQCSPDHPWLREHPDWFNWRVDGSLKHAENPPKRYEDIVTPDFYSPLASTPRQAALWRALRDIVIFWVQQGVRIFRVDNPHTKPLPFWEWMLREVRDRYPDTLFLSEAFTRPAMMYRLAKLGFSQSYTYFTWRNTKQELTDYLLELNREPVRDFFRPNFFVNTPDINPWFLQTSGRAGFLIRAVLAGTLSGSWGMYNGFELCVADAVPGKEEYLDSEKYQLRQWDMNAPGNIVEEITALNRIRRSHPALQSHLGIRFHHVDNDQILFYSRHSAEGDSVVLVAVSLDPHHRQSGTLELPLQEWGLREDASFPLHDLFGDRRFQARGRWQHIELTPERPFVLWARVLEHGEAV